MKEIIAIVDDEPDIVELIELNLKKEGFRSKGFNDAKSFYNYLKREIPDILILDLMLPDIDGIEICKYLKSDKKFSDIGIIMLTAKSDEFDKVFGLEIGADDYMTKPFSPRELIARIKALLRRKNGSKEKNNHNKKRVISIDNILKIYLDKYEVLVSNKPVKLTTTEFKILELLSSNRGWVFSRDQILDFLWGDEKVVVDRTIDVHIRHLRQKLGKAGKLIKNIRGVGYKLE